MDVDYFESARCSCDCCGSGCAGSKYGVCGHRSWCICHTHSRELWWVVRHIDGVLERLRYGASAGSGDDACQYSSHCIEPGGDCRNLWARNLADSIGNGWNDFDDGDGFACLADLCRSSRRDIIGSANDHVENDRHGSSDCSKRRIFRQCINGLHGDRQLCGNGNSEECQLSIEDQLCANSNWNAHGSAYDRCECLRWSNLGSTDWHRVVSGQHSAYAGEPELWHATGGDDFDVADDLCTEHRREHGNDLCYDSKCAF